MTKIYGLDEVITLRVINNKNRSFYLNRVYDTRKASSDKYHYWVTKNQPDFSGSLYNGPGVFGVDTSDYCVLSDDIHVDDYFEKRIVIPEYWEKPAVSHPLDDEFESDTLGSEWSVYNLSAASGTSFTEGIDAYSAAANDCHYEINPVERPSYLLIQPKTSNVLYVYKPCSLPTNVLVMARMRFNLYVASIATNDRLCGLRLFDSSVAPIATSLLQESDFTCQAQSASGAQSTNVDRAGQALEYVVIHKLGTTYHYWVGTSGGNWIYMGSTTDATAVAYVGFIFGSTNSSYPGDGIMGVDFVRFFETDKFWI